MPAAGDQVVARLIAAFDDEQLAALLAARPDLVDPPLRSIGALQQRAGSWNSVQRCLQSVDLAGQQVIQALSLLPASTSVAELARLLGPGVSVAELDPVLDRLTALALLARKGGSLRLAGPARQTRYPAGLGPRLAELTDRLRVDDLRIVAQHLGADQRKRKADLEAVVQAELTRPGRVEQLLATAPEPARTLALALAAGPPAVDAPYSYRPRRELTPLEWLQSRGLLLGPSYGTAIMPREVAIALRGGRVFPHLQLAPPPVELRTVDPAAVLSRSVEQAGHLVAGLARLLEELEQRPATLLKSGGVGIREVRRAATVLAVPEEAAAQVIELAAAAGLLGRADGRLLVTPGFDAWRDGDTTTRWAALVAAWLDLSWHLSLAGSPDPYGKPTPPMLGHPANGHARRVRRLLLAALAGPAVGTAATVESLAAALAWATPNAWSGRRRAGDLVGELHLLGLAVDGAVSSLGRALAASGLPAAREALAAQLPPLCREFVLQADLTAIASGELAPDVRRELELMADPESSGGASVYRFSPASVRRAFDVGRDSASLLAFLTEHAVRGVPQPLAYLLGDLGRRFGRLRVRAVGCYLRSEDTALLAELTRVRAFARLGLCVVAPTVVTATADEPTVMAALRAEGYLPAVETADGQLQLVRPAPPRAPVTAPAGRAAEPDLAALVARLREGKPEPIAAQHTPVPNRALPDHDSDDGPPRPTFHSTEPPTMRALLGLAIEQEWAVAITVLGVEVVVLPWELGDGGLYGEAADSGEELRLPVTDLEGVRILDLAEEDRAVLGG